MMNLYKYRETLIKARLLRSLALNLVIAILAFIILPQNIPFLIVYTLFLLKTFYLSARNLDHFDALTLFVNSMCYVFITHNLVSTYNTAIASVAITYNVLNLALHTFLILRSNIIPNFKLDNNISKYRFPIGDYHYSWYMAKFTGLKFTPYCVSRQYHHAHRPYYAFVVNLPSKCFSEISFINIGSNKVRALVTNTNSLNSVADYFYPKKDTFKLLYTKDNIRPTSSLWLDTTTAHINKTLDFISVILEKNTNNEVLRLIVYASDEYNFRKSLPIINMILENEHNFQRKDINEKDF